MFTLRDYQHKAHADCRDSFAAGHRRILLQAPTGSGKTVIAAQIVKSAVNKGRCVLFLAHRRELVEQCCDKLIKFGVDHGIIMAGEYPELYYEVQVASIDTIRARCLQSNKLPLPKADVIIIDECHRSLAPTYLQIMGCYPDAAILGLTATPIRGDGKGLGHVYSDIIHCPSVQKLTDMGFLVPARYFAPTIPDLTGVKVDGDYDRRELEVAMNQRRLVGDIVTHWHRLALGRPTVVFASGVRHSINLRDEFVKSGVKAEHIDGETKLADRKNIIRNIRSGRTRVITNYGVLTEGFDEPKLSCCVMARPTRNFGLSIQMAGRTLRPADDKKDTIILDHSGNVYEHGFIADDHQWILEEGRALTTDRKKRQETFDAKGPITCIKCSAMFIGQRMCPYCGYLPQRKGEYLETRHGELMEVRAKKRRTAKKRTYTMDEKQQWYSMFIFYCTEKKYKPGWAAAKYKTKFKVWPKGLHKVPAAPSSECLSYIRAMNIRYAKSKEKKAAA